MATGKGQPKTVHSSGTPLLPHSRVESGRSWGHGACRRRCRMCRTECCHSSTVTASDRGPRARAKTAALHTLCWRAPSGQYPQPLGPEQKAGHKQMRGDSVGAPEKVSRCPQPAARHGHAATLGNKARPGGRLDLALKLLSGHVHYGPFPLLGQGTARPPPTLHCYREERMPLGASSSRTCSLPSCTPGPPCTARLFGNGDRQEAREGALPGPPGGTETPAQAFLLPLPPPPVHSSPHSSHPLAAVRCPGRHGLSAGLFSIQQHLVKTFLGVPTAPKLHAPQAHKPLHGGPAPSPHCVGSAPAHRPPAPGPGLCPSCSSRP